MKQYVFKSAKGESRQISDELVLGSGLIEPAFSFDRLLSFFYSNIYHQRALKLKASILSNVEDGSSLEAVCDNPKALLESFVLNLEIFGNAFLELEGARAYILPSVEARVKAGGEVWQVKNAKERHINARHMKYYSPLSRYYGEPDYLSALNAININLKADSFNNAFFENSARADKAIIFENAEPSDDQINAFKTFFNDNFKGYEKSHKTLVITAGGDNAKVRIEDLSKVDDISFKELKEVTKAEIITAHGVPPRMLGITQSAQLGGNGELIGQLHMFNELTIVPKQEQIEWFFYQIGLPIKLKKIDVTDYKDDSSIVTQLVAGGILTPSEARTVLGYQASSGEMQL